MEIFLVHPTKNSLPRKFKHRVRSAIRAIKSSAARSFVRCVQRCGVNQPYSQGRTIEHRGAWTAGFSPQSYYSLHPILIDIFLYGIIIKISNVLINLINATQTFYLSSIVLTWNSSLLVLFIATAHANNKYSYHFLTFNFLKYIYQNRMEGVIGSGYE